MLHVKNTADHMVQNAREAPRWAGVHTEKYSKHFPNSDELHASRKPLANNF